MAKNSYALSGLIVALVIALVCNIHDAAARDVKLVKLRDVKPETLKKLNGEKESEIMKGEEKNNLLKEIEKAKKMLGELKTLKKQSTGDMKSELSSLVKSESLLNEISDSLKNGTYNHIKANIFVEKESFFYRAWKENAYNSVVPEKEKEYMSTIKRIVKLLKKT
ncbi:unnamed protein product [Arabidopsis lyrata]|uniref:Uncharacterized protein n=1 Tax=Arabidopsis lyrata subsp. lyrata TaxID=81972 RepID=D7LAH5_ARALL|nr:uncharacterized protein LOC9318258 [Arabidopsis lyrata subsp. lyrata]EFH60546.1 hypothetical protein ARALYDRAFT_477403 [Arabidopsis lyrata subsp. lyrata]CAH8258963.1 unnamed protein product [Arabidopsis lyrata]|eukprot:XP_020888152.1 uncharacterized protein LOC9318258 [Arabidopsis lyrata subsp. lyrata]